MPKIVSKMCSVLSLFVLSGAAYAGRGIGIVEYGPLLDGVSTPVPALGGLGLLILAGLLSAVSFRFLKQGGKGNHLLVAAGMTAALVTAGGGVKLVSDAYAGLDFSLVELDSSSGGVAVIEFEGLNRVINESGVFQSIQGLEVSSGCDILEPEGPNGGQGGGNGGLDGLYRGACLVGMGLANFDYCELYVQCPDECSQNGGEDNGGDLCRE